MDIETMKKMMMMKKKTNKKKEKIKMVARRLRAVLVRALHRSGCSGPNWCPTISEPFLAFVPNSSAFANAWMNYHMNAYRTTSRHAMNYVVYRLNGQSSPGL